MRSVRGRGRKPMPLKLRHVVTAATVAAVAVALLSISQASGSTTRSASITPPPAFTGSELDAIPDGDWIDAFGSEYGDRYSALNQITTANVSTLHTVWHLNLNA